MEKNGDVEIGEILDASSLVTTSILNTEISEVENTIPDNSKYIPT